MSEPRHVDVTAICPVCGDMVSNFETVGSDAPEGMVVKFSRSVECRGLCMSRICSTPAFYDRFDAESGSRVRTRSGVEMGTSIQHRNGQWKAVKIYESTNPLDWR